MERRYFTVNELRAVDSSTKKKTLLGYALRWYKLSNLIPVQSLRYVDPEIKGYIGYFREMFIPSSFNNSLKMDDQHFFVEHNRSKSYGDTLHKTLRLNADTIGLRFELDVAPEDMALYDAVKNGRLNSMSFGFQVTKDNWTRHDDTLVRTVHEAKLIEISAVRHPAHRDTSLNIAMSDERKRLLLKTMTL